jgi:hypothetical protein
VKIKWEEFEPYSEGMTAEDKEKQDWNIFFMSLRYHSMRYILIDQPNFFGSPKLSALLNERLI